MLLRTLLAVALLWIPAVAVRDGLDMTYTNLEVIDAFRGKKPQVLHPAQMLEFSLAPDRSGTSANMMLSKKTIFSFANDSIACVPIPSSNKFLVQSDSLVETSDEIAAAVGSSSSYGLASLGPAFAASVSAGMDAASSTNSEKSRSDLFIIAKICRATTEAIYPAKKLRPEVRQFLLSESPEDIIEKFGAFYASAIELGGLVRATTTKTKSENEDIKSFEQKMEASAVSGNLQVVSGGASNDFSKSFGNKNANSEMSTKVSTLGGDSQIWLRMGSHDSMSQIQKEWAESVTDENMAPIKFTLMPLWSLLEDIGCQDCQERANALKETLTKRWAKDLERLEEQDRLAKRAPGQIGDVVAFSPLNYPGKRMLVAESSFFDKLFRKKKWYKVGEKSQRSLAEAFTIKKGLAGQVGSGRAQKARSTSGDGFGKHVDFSDPSYISFESKASPGEYIVACDGLWGRKYVCHKRIWSAEDKSRATWIMNRGFEKASSKSFESLFYPEHYMDLQRNDGGIVWVQLSEVGGDSFSRRGASWKLDFAEPPAS